MGATTVADGLLALARAQILEIIAQIAIEKQMHSDPPVRAEPDEPPIPESH
jgi:hypothetical protein